MIEQKKIVRGFSLGDSDMVVIDQVAEKYGVSASAALRIIVKAYKQSNIEPRQKAAQDWDDFANKPKGKNDEQSTTDSLHS